MDRIMHRDNNMSIFLLINLTRHLSGSIFCLANIGLPELSLECLCGSFPHTDIHTHTQNDGHRYTKSI